MSEMSVPASRRTQIMTFTGGVAVAMVVLVLDQLSKWWILAKVMQPPQVIPVTSFFNLVLGWNRGISFGLFHGDSAFNDWGLPALALVIVAVLLVWLWRAEGRLVPLAVGLIIGGALGNVIDRIRHGAVADFLDFYVAGYHWPAFNLADTGITVGALLLIFDSLFGAAERPNNTL